MFPIAPACYLPPLWQGVQECHQHLCRLGPRRRFVRTEGAVGVTSDDPLLERQGHAFQRPVRDLARVAFAEEQDPSAKALFELVNVERLRAGREALVLDPALIIAAERHARDIIARGYFGHLDPDGVTPARRARLAGVEFGVLGENLAGNTSIADAHRMLMASPAHRGNILNSRYSRVGIAVITGGPYGLMIVEMFAGD